jgi:DNA-binding Xre family transcriptional regulator
MSTEFPRILRALKTAIKAKGFTYKILAKKIGMSEAGLKRLLNANDCSLQRILKICGTIEIPFDDLVAISESVDEETQSFTPAQNELFEKSIEHLKYYYKLRVEHLSPDLIATQMSLARGKGQRILFDLDRVGLIKLLSGNKIADLGRRNVRWVKIGPAMLDLKYGFTEDLMNYFKHHRSRHEGYYSIYHLEMSDRLRNELYNEQAALIEKYNKLSERQRFALKSREIRPLNIAILAAPIHGFASTSGT